jgi:para-nitrobenzyl esterase
VTILSAIDPGRIPHLPGSTAAIVTESGPLKGIETSIEDQFLGIPYAAPPVGNLRWVPPQPRGQWQGVLDATQFGNYCTQPDGAGGTFGDEDCLTLNVYRPHQMKNANQTGGVAVMVWIHGGGLAGGGSADYDPSPLVLGGNVLVVTINYRLGYLGFLAHPALDAEGHLAGNYGLMDQQFALRWVQNNIAAFGGDPTRVTIFGESAGGQSVYTQLASPLAAGLFVGAIAESGSYASFAPYLHQIVPLAVGETSDAGYGVPPGTSIASSVGCASQTAQCLRSTLASTLVLAEPGTVSPFVDGTLLTQPPGAAFASGQFNHVPVISGTNHDEWRGPVAIQYGSSLATEADYEAAVDALWDGFGPFIWGVFYPPTNYPIVPPIPGDPNPSPGIALGASGTDGIYSCPARNADQSLSQFVTTYAYEFNDENAPTAGLMANFPLGARHFGEVRYLFDVFGAPSSPLLTTAQKALSNAMIGYWTTFAATGSPNFSGAPFWPQYNTSTDEFQSLVPPTPAPEFNFATDHMCTNLWG